MLRNLTTDTQDPSCGEMTFMVGPAARTKRRTVRLPRKPECQNEEVTFVIKRGPNDRRNKVTTRPPPPTKSRDSASRAKPGVKDDNSNNSNSSNSSNSTDRRDVGNSTDRRDVGNSSQNKRDVGNSSHNNSNSTDRRDVGNSSHNNRDVGNSSHNNRDVGNSSQNNRDVGNSSHNNRDVGNSSQNNRDEEDTSEEERGSYPDRLPGARKYSANTTYTSGYRKSSGVTSRDSALYRNMTPADLDRKTSATYTGESLSKRFSTSQDLDRKTSVGFSGEAVSKRMSTSNDLDRKKSSGLFGDNFYKRMSTSHDDRKTSVGFSGEGMYNRMSGTDLDRRASLAASRTGNLKRISTFEELRSIKDSPSSTSSAEVNQSTASNSTRASKDYSMKAAKVKEEVLRMFRFYQEEEEERVGTISFRNVGLAMRALGFCPSESELEDAIVQMVTLGNIDLYVPENVFVTVVTKLKLKGRYPRDDCSQIVQAFRVLDRRGTGMMNVDELSTIMTKEGETFSTHEMDMMTQMVVQDKSTEFDYTAYAHLLCHHTLAV